MEADHGMYVAIYKKHILMEGSVAWLKPLCGDNSSHVHVFVRGRRRSQVAHTSSDKSRAGRTRTNVVLSSCSLKATRTAQGFSLQMKPLVPTSEPCGQIT
jgi:hypothetical protein